MVSVVDQMKGTYNNIYSDINSCKRKSVELIPHDKNDVSVVYLEHETKDKYKYIYVEYLDMPNDRMYCYLPNCDNVEKGDIVEVNKSDEKTYGRVINIVDYSKEDVPYPVENMKFINKVIKEEDEKKFIELYYEHADLVIAHNCCFENETILKESQKCGCFFCCKIFNSSEINE